MATSAGIEAFDSLHAWQARQAADPARYAAQAAATAALATSGADGVDGHCGLCARPVRFALTPVPGQAANLREELACPGCRMTSRNRAAMAQVIAGQALDRARIYLTEQASVTFVWLQRHATHADGSEFGLTATLRPRLQRWFHDLGGHGPLVERDVTSLDFADASLDVIGSYDVLEHVPDYPAALREFARVLRPGGRLVLTLPFVESAQETLVRARLHADGTLEHLQPPEMHGDPVAGGVLCFYHFGWDLLDAVRTAGFGHAVWQRAWSPGEGLFGLWTLVATR